MPAKKKVKEAPVEEAPVAEVAVEEVAQELNEGGFKQVEGHGWSDEELAARAESAAK